MRPLNQTLPRPTLNPKPPKNPFRGPIHINAATFVSARSQSSRGAFKKKGGGRKGPKRRCCKDARQEGVVDLGEGGGRYNTFSSTRDHVIPRSLKCALSATIWLTCSSGFRWKQGLRLGWALCLVECLLPTGLTGLNPQP